MGNFEKECSKKIVSVVNALLAGQLGLREKSDAVRAVAINKDGSGGLICWTDAPSEGQKATLPRCHCGPMTKFTAKSGGKKLELATFAPL